MIVNPVEAESAQVDPSGHLAHRREPGQQQPGGGRAAAQCRQADDPASVHHTERSPLLRIVELREGPMGVFKAIFSGMGTTFRKPRLLVILYAVNLVFAGLVALP
ncbi:MAG: hypothetical protein MZV70_18430 [Desulfobacterales bacterium]|nr:hypothetical protein [Desulfobacterales bacterium]